MTTPNEHNPATDAEIALYKTFIRDGVDEFNGELVAELIARIEALIAERDAAVARAELSEAELSGVKEYLPTAIAESIAEGERRATAAIVADLRAKRTIHHNAMAARYERGDHITEAKP
jgi:hypothetical protein